MNDKLLQQIKTGYEHDDFAMQIIHHLHDLVAKGSRVTKQASNFEFKDGYLLWKGTDSTRLYIPDNETLRIDMIEQFHVPAHFGTDKTYAKLARHVYWSGMYDDTDKFCSACHDCQVNKVPNTGPQGKLQPHEIPTTVWDVITMDFLTELARCSAGFDSVFVIVEKLSKRAIFIPTTKGVTAAGAAQLLQDAVFSKQGIPVKMISDRDPKFKSNFWKSLAQLLNIKLNVSTSDHPQTDGQCEVMIKILSNMIRKAIQEEKENWQTVLSTMEFEYNSSKNASTGLTPFEVDLGRIPHNPVTRKLEACGVKCQIAADLVEKRNAFRALARDNLAEAQARQRHYANIKRKDVKFEEGDLVLLRSEDLSAFSRADLPAKWRSKYIGSLKITAVMGPVTYRVELPPSMKRAHNVFHVSKLRQYKQPLGRKGTLSVVIDADGTVKQEVYAILDKKREQRRIYYLVQFMDEPVSEAVWMTRAELKNCKDLVREYETSTRKSNLRKG